MKKFTQLTGIISVSIMCDSLLAAGTYYSPQIDPKDQSMLNFFAPRLGFSKKEGWDNLPDLICEPDACRKDKQIVCYRGKKDPGTINNKKSCQQQQRERLYKFIGPKVPTLSTDGLPVNADPDEKLNHPNNDNGTPIIPIIIPNPEPPKPDPLSPPPPPPGPDPIIPIPTQPSVAVCSVRGAKALRMNINNAFAAKVLTDPTQRNIREKEWAALNAELVAIMSHTNLSVKKAKLKAIYNTNQIYQKAMLIAYPQTVLNNIKVFSSCYLTIKDNASFNTFIGAFLNPADVATPKGALPAKKN